MDIPANPPPSSQSPRETALRKVAADLETAFLAEMLKHSGLGKARESFGGGIGEEHFASMLAETQAAHLTKSGGIGLTEHIFQSLKDRENV